MAILDLRQPDERANYLPNPFWLRSAVLDISAVGTSAVFFSFPLIKGAITQIHSCAFEMTEVFNGTSPSIIIGTGTIATDAITTGGAISVVDADYLFETGEITEGTAGWYFPSASAVLDAWVAGTPAVITHADATVPVVYATYTATTPTTGKGRLHMLVSVLYKQ